ncbi:hypothetical protein [Mycobacterium sp. ITM-2016-00318]|uniref:hypothetical protein n=1 Tax=Mycobacterium sp. ITM-2016-00318 TaxID=2099693 RepID=UPI001E4BDC65|nr:hypothetical protein [Mycobacterium sp. ITM-2016-00318]WNG93996.1 hypothetical protein C6A82_005955 [Mycobacterium sp. ITM-2016-00318]
MPASVVDDICTARLTSVTANAADGTITGTPVGGGTAITLAGQEDAYEKSAGFGEAPPDPVRRWDETIDHVSGLDVDASNPNWYGNAKAKVFLPRTSNDLATQFPPDTALVQFFSDDAQPNVFRLVTIQPRNCMPEATPLDVTCRD